MAYKHVCCVQVLVSPHFCFSLYRSLNIFTSLSCIAHLQHLSKCLDERNPLFPSMRFAFSWFLYFFHCKEQCILFLCPYFPWFIMYSIKEKIVLRNAPSSGTYGVWCPVNGGRLEALRGKTFIDELSISLWSFTV